jgi:hypothetical protein
MKFNYIFLFLFFSHALLAQDTIVLSDKKKDTTPMGNAYQFIEDKENRLTEKTILSDSVNKIFVKGDTFGYTNEELRSTYWGRFTLKTGNENKFWLLEIVDPHIQNIDFYELRNGVLVPYSSTKGLIHPFSLKEFFHKNYVFDLDLSDGTAHTYYIKFKSNLHNSFAVKVRSAEFMISYSVTEYFLLGLYYGILVIMAIYNLFIYFSVRENTYIYYVLYVIACGFTSMNEDGLGFQFLWPEYPGFNIFSILMMPLFLMIAFMMYSSSFLDLKNRLPVFNNIAYALVGMNVLFLAVNGLFYDFLLSFQVVYLLPFAFIYVAAIYTIKNGDRPARYFLLGYSFILLSIIIFYLRTKGIVAGEHFMAVYSFNYGFILEVVILSYALSERLKDEKIQKEKAQKHIIEQLKENEKYKDELNKELERKVEERTTELKAAGEEISRMNKFLSQHNLKLQEDVKHISKERIMQREVSFDEFKLTYPNEESCFQFLSDLKWSKGYTCRKCGNDKFNLMPNLARRCNKCKYIESSTAFTIFHSLKFSILDAFYMLFLVNTRKDITAEELSKTIQLSEKSCSSFKRKMANAEKSLKGKVKDKSGWERLISYYEEE